MGINLQPRLSSFKNPSEMGRELLLGARVDAMNTSLWNILFWFDFYCNL